MAFKLLKKSRICYNLNEIGVTKADYKSNLLFLHVYSVPSIKCNYAWHAIIMIYWKHYLWKFGGDKTLQTSMAVNNILKYLKNNNIQGRTITCSYIWHVDKLKCTRWLDIYSVKVWWRYVQPNTNGVPFCDIFFRQGSVFNLPIRTVPKIKNFASLG